MSENKNRSIELDLFKILLVIGMVAAHVFQLLYNGEGESMVINCFSIYINAITFSGFLFCFGCATQLAYLRRLKDSLLAHKLIKNGVRLLIAFYISGIAYSAFVCQSLSIKETVKILLLWSIPGYSEFLLSFAMLMPLVWFLYRPFNAICSNKVNMGGVILLSLFSTFLPYKYVKIPLLGVLVGSTKFACFPLLQYSMFFLFGIFFCKQGMKMTNKILLISFMLTGTSFAYIIFHHSIPNRFPPTCFWILLPCASLAVYWKFLSIVKNLSFFNRHKKQIGIYGSNMLDYLVLSNVLIFLARFIYGHNLNVSLCLMMIVFILVSCICYTYIKLWHNQ